MYAQWRETKPLQVASEYVISNQESQITISIEPVATLLMECTTSP